MDNKKDGEKKLGPNDIVTPSGGVITKWVKGQSGNPRGRPKGSGKIQKKVKEQIALAASLQLAHDARKLLNDNSKTITFEVMRIALKDEPKPSQAKVKCLLACFERIVPALKVVEINQGAEAVKPSEMSDAQIIELMQRMVGMANNENSHKAIEVLDG